MMQRAVNANTGREAKWKRGGTEMIDIKDMSHVPSIGEISAYIGLPLFGAFCQYMDVEYKAICKIEYSKDVWARGWNV